MMPIGNAISAYQATAQRSVSQPAQTATPATGGTPSFGTLVKNAVSDAIDTGKQSEAMGKAAVLGKADITEVAQAVTNADVTLQSVVAVRDKVVAAYQEIMRMPI